jgi:hypothetical protein
MQEAASDPFAIPPQIWFGVICHAIGKEEGTGNISLIGVFNQTEFVDPPAETGLAPHGALNCILAVGFSGGLGHFEAQIDLRDVDGNILWTRPEGPFGFTVGPGEQYGAVLAQQVRYWFKRRGEFYFRVYLVPAGGEHRIQFQVGPLGPTEVMPSDPPTEPA